MKEKGRWFVYVLLLQGGALYTGCTCDLGARLRRHVAGTASRCTRSFPPVEVAACWEVGQGRGAAMSVEAFIKASGRGGKETLVRDPRSLPGLYDKESGRELDIQAVTPLPRLPQPPGGPRGR